MVYNNNTKQIILQIKNNNKNYINQLISLFPEAIVYQNFNYFKNKIIQNKSNQTKFV